MTKFIKNIFQNSVYSYIFFGCCTTFVNLGIYYILRVTTAFDTIIINVISIFCAIVFAYFTNAKYVFHSNTIRITEKVLEFVKFFSARIFTMIIEVVGVEIFVLIEVDDRIGKVLVQFLVLVLNYLISKFLVFVKK